MWTWLKKIESWDLSQTESCVGYEMSETTVLNKKNWEEISVDYFIEKEQRTTLQIKQLAGNKKYITVSKITWNI